MKAIEKLDGIFKYYPWLLTSKNVVHMPFRDDKDKPLPGMTWMELKELVDTAKLK